MATKKINTTESMTEDRQTDVSLKFTIGALAKQYQEEKKVRVMIPKSLETRYGKTLPVGVNGVFVIIPVDGKYHEVNETHARHLEDMLSKA